jgi:hypothetical protein
MARASLDKDRPKTDGAVRFLSQFVCVERHTLSHRNKSVNLTAWPVHVTNLALAIQRQNA